MTRQPCSPLSETEQASVDSMARYLSKLSESRQVMMMRCLHKNRIRMAVEDRLVELTKHGKKGW